jgi:hypothetical protein
VSLTYIDGKIVAGVTGIFEVRVNLRKDVTTSVVDIGGKFAAGINDTKIFEMALMG